MTVYVILCIIYIILHYIYIICLDIDEREITYSTNLYIINTLTTLNMYIYIFINANTYSCMYIYRYLIIVLYTKKF